MFASRYLVVVFRESVVWDSTLICFDSEGGCGNGAAAVCNDVAVVGNGAVMADVEDDMAAASRFTPLSVFLLFDDVTTDCLGCAESADTRRTTGSCDAAALLVDVMFARDVASAGVFASVLAPATAPATLPFLSSSSSGLICDEPLGAVLVNLDVLVFNDA